MEDGAGSDPQASKRAQSPPPSALVIQARTNPCAKDLPEEMDDHKVSLEDFTVHGLVGEGEFGKVLMATKVDTGKMYAMKVLRKEHLIFRGASSVKQAITEKQVLQEMAAKPHPFIVSLNFAFQDMDHLFLVMDFVGGGDLFSMLEQKQRFPEPWVQIYGAEIALALEHVHEACSGIIILSQP